jgi:hypothetical protein
MWFSPHNLQTTPFMEGLKPPADKQTCISIPKAILSKEIMSPMVRMDDHVKWLKYWKLGLFVFNTIVTFRVARAYTSKDQEMVSNNEGPF